MSDEHTILRSAPEVTVFRLIGQARMRPCLILYSGADAGRRFDLGPGRHLIGRSVDAAVQLNLPGVSRRHAEIEVDGDVVTVRDLGSANRTRVNDVPVEDATVLRQGDLLQVDNVVLRYHDQQSLDALLHDRIYRLAMTDAGTDTYNRRYLADVLEREVHRARRGKHRLSAVCFDLDHFKQVNDRHGHAAGDQVLRECAQRVQKALRGSDVLCRTGGEEFVVLLPDTALDAAVALAERLRSSVGDRPFPVNSNGASESTLLDQTISLGVAELLPDLADAGTLVDLADGAALLDLADRRLYAAKNSGRNRVVASDGDSGPPTVID